MHFCILFGRNSWCRKIEYSWYRNLFDCLKVHDTKNSPNDAENLASENGFVILILCGTEKYLSYDDNLVDGWCDKGDEKETRKLLVMW